MFVFSYYYKADSMKENLGYVNADSYDEALELVAEVKRLSAVDTMQLFEIVKNN